MAYAPPLIDESDKPPGDSDSGSRLHCTSVRILHMVDEAPQERVVRTAMVLGDLVWEEEITIKA